MPTREKKRTLSYNAVVGALWLQVGSKPAVGYWIDELSHDFGAGARCFRLSKMVPPVGGEPDHYDVVIGAEGSRCECRGFLRWNRCKHAGSIRCLIERGSL